MSKRVPASILVLVIVLVTTLETSFNAFSTATPNISGYPWVVIEDSPGDRLRVETVSDEVWAELVQLYLDNGERWIGGIVETYDNEWGFRFDPEMILIYEYVAEIYQTTIRMISEDLNYWLGNLAYVWPKVIAIGTCDIDGDGAVDSDDFYLFARAYGTSPPSNPDCDIDLDGNVDSDDLYIFAGNYGKIM